MSVLSIPFVKTAYGEYRETFQGSAYLIFVELTDGTKLEHSAKITIKHVRSRREGQWLCRCEVDQAWENLEEALLFGEIEGMTKEHLEKLRGETT